MMQRTLVVLAFAVLAFAALAGTAALPASAAGVGEPLARAAAKYGLTADDVAALRAAGGELYCPGNGTNGARLNGWLVGSTRQIVTNAHGIVYGGDDGPHLRQPLSRCTFSSFLDLGSAAPPRAYRINTGAAGSLFRNGARAPVDPGEDIGGDVVKLALDRSVARGKTLTIDTSTPAVGDELLLVSRTPTGLQTRAGDGDLLVQRCRVTMLDPPSKSYSRGVITDCDAVGGMSAGVFVAHSGTRLVAKGLLVSVKYADLPGGRLGPLIGAHHLALDARFQTWLRGGCPFLPAALKVRACGR